MKDKIMLTIYSLVHCIVDLSCAAYLSSIIVTSFDPISVSRFILLYNCLAFITQWPLGVLFNNKNKNAYVSMFGCILILLGYIFGKITLLPVILIGLGNAFFHIGGGIDILNISNKKASKIGIYVAPGALGLFIGTSINKLKYPIWIVIVLLIISIIALYLLGKNTTTKVKQKEISVLDLKLNKQIVVYFILVAICIRGLLGFVLNYSWKSDFSLALILVIMVVLGKMIGGILADKFGLGKVGVVSLFLSAILFIFSFDSIVIAMISVFLFNMTMPLTLILLSNYLNHYGLAFGLNTTALLFGALLTFDPIPDVFFSRVGLFSLVFISLILFYFSYKKVTNK